jgi:hypothetical protein
MIPYEDLCVALEAYAARVHGHAPPVDSHRPTPGQHAAAEPAPFYDEPELQAAPLDPPTGEAQLPVDPHPALHSTGAEDDSTHVGQMPSTMPAIYEDQSNELDIGDVLADEDASSDPE